MNFWYTTIALVSRYNGYYTLDRQHHWVKFPHGNAKKRIHVLTVKSHKQKECRTHKVKQNTKDMEDVGNNHNSWREQRSLHLGGKFPCSQMSNSVWFYFSILHVFHGHRRSTSTLSLCAMFYFFLSNSTFSPYLFFLILPLCLCLWLFSQFLQLSFLCVYFMWICYFHHHCHCSFLISV